jgi:pimeloyl-ACP methyl ester carboxylesterase
MQTIIQLIKKYAIILIVFIIGIQSCSKEDQNNPVEPVVQERGEIVHTISLGIMTADEIQQIFTLSNTQIPFTLNYSVEIISVSYYTANRNGDLAIVSGALLIPQGVNNFPLFSLQHGTQTKRDLVASVSPSNSVEGTIGLITASLGYLTVIPDYIGFGVSDEMHTYLHAESLIPSIIDLMRASKTYCSENQLSLDGRVFLTGYSEGGYTSLLTQKEIEENHNSEFDLTAVAPLAGPYDLKGTVDSAFQSSNYGGDLAYIGYFFTAYNKIYGWNRLNEIFRAPYASRMPGLYDGSKTWGEILSQLPSTFSELMNPDFVANYINGNETDVIAAIQENTILNWTPQTPIHFFHGDADVTVPYQNVLTAISAFQSNGASNILLTTIPGGNHASAGPAASFGAIQWFESF